MEISRNQRIKKQKARLQFEQLNKVNTKMRQSMAVLGSTVMVALYTSPVAQVLAAEKVQTGTAAFTSNPFLNSLIPSAQKVSENKDIYTSVMLAQAALETGWGNSTLSQSPNHNLFGIKGDYQGASVDMKTLEDSGGQNYYQITAQFRKYPSYQEALEDYTGVILNGPKWNPAYYSGAWKSNTSSYKDATAYLTGRYATDTAYASKLNRIIEQYDLTRFDNGTAIELADDIANNGVTDETIKVIEGQPSTSTNTPITGGYTVKAGDTLYAISRNTGVSVSTLYRENGLSSTSIIYPGQVLKLGSQAATPAPAPVENTTKPATPVTPNVTKPNTGGTSYTVVSGDTLYGISRKTGASLTTLYNENGLSSASIIYPGQVLNVGGQASTPTPAPVETKPAPSTPVVESVSAGSYTVVSGDTLYGISRKTGVAIGTLYQANDLSSSSIIYPGQVLSLDGQASTTAPAVTKPAPSAPVTEATSSGSYTVVSGDTLYGIARKTGLAVDSLYQANDLSSSSIIYPGQVLNLGGQASTPTPVAESKPTPSAPVVVETTSSGSYTVASGDTLYGIARKTGVSLTTLYNANGLSSNSIIYPGQVLNLGGQASAPAPQVTESTTSSVAETSSNGSTYTVKAGDGLWRIAKNHGLTLEELKDINGLDSNLIQPGQILKVSR
ncbi:LysM peptidoglycan-binding domain-containing protein [Granulicatella seriolae]|uniref:Peptidoglycan hydrolase n=1 Tax=Granulicatella seriolae TaxID=2967226 RepID=A0ABT1WLG4_9LACT|nr:LysM peptidoglycan-binding domain-containing protein [Granulicatella seriolae]